VLFDSKYMLRLKFIALYSGCWSNLSRIDARVKRPDRAVAFVGARSAGMMSDPGKHDPTRHTLEAYRRADYPNAITIAGAAFERSMKTICRRKAWPFDADRHGCSDLVEVCRSNGLFPAFYAPCLIVTGTVRNKLGDAHGRGPVPQNSVGKVHADHMLRLASTNITFVVALSGL
jgi:hypothetical protein